MSSKIDIRSLRTTPQQATKALECLTRGMDLVSVEDKVNKTQTSVEDLYWGGMYLNLQQQTTVGGEGFQILDIQNPESLYHTQQTLGRAKD